MANEWLNRDFFFGEDDFNEKMSTTVSDWLKTVKEDYLSVENGIRLHYYAAINPYEKAAIAICHGFCEFFDKYHEMAWYLYKAGYSVFFVDHRGHGKSTKVELDDIGKVYVKDYSEYVSDYHEFVHRVVKPLSKTDKLILLGHSMGGCISSLYLSKYPEDFSLAVLSSPMHRMSFKGRPMWQVKLIMTVAAILKWDKRYVPGQGPFIPGNWFERSSTLSFVRWEYAQNARLACDDYKTFGGTFAWIRASIKATKRLFKGLDNIKIPILLLEAGKDTMVDNSAHDEFADRVPTTKTLVFPNSKHEIFNSVSEDRYAFYTTIFEWIDNNMN